MRRLSVGFSLSSFGFLPYHGHARAIHLHVEGGYGLTDGYRQVQLHGLLDLTLLTLGDIAANALGGALDRFSRHIQAGQKLHLLAAVIERRLGADQRLHAAHRRRRFDLFDVEFAVHGKLPLMTVRTQIPGTQQFHFAQRRENAPPAPSAVTRLFPTGTRTHALIGWRCTESQQLRQRRCSSLMQRGAERHFHRFQVHLAAVLALGKDTA